MHRSLVASSNITPTMKCSLKKNSFSSVNNLIKHSSRVLGYCEYHRSRHVRPYMKAKDPAVLKREECKMAQVGEAIRNILPLAQRTMTSTTLYLSGAIAGLTDRGLAPPFRRHQERRAPTVQGSSNSVKHLVPATRAEAYLLAVVGP